MDALDEYLHGPYQEDRREVEEVGRRLEGVWPVFTEFYSSAGQAGWPYEIKAGEEAKTPAFSFSTNAMILFALGVALRKVDSRSCHLTPRVVYEADLGKHKSRIEDVYERALANFISRVGRVAPLFKSDSFGTDDPFTSTWALNLVYQAISAPALTPALTPAQVAQNEFRERLIDVAWKRVTSAFKNPSQSMLVYPATTGNKPAGLDHPFPLLRAVQLYRTLSDLVPTSDPAKADERREAKKEAASALQAKARPHLLNRVYEHLSLAEVKNGAFDAAELVFSLEGLLLADADARSVDSNLVDQVFRVIDRSQDLSAYWRPLKPFVTNSRGFALLPLSVEIANSLLRLIKLLDEDDVKRPNLTARMPLLRRYAQWLYTRMVRGSATPAGGSAPVEYAGWHSEHVHAPRRVHTWETAQVAIFLMHYRTMLQEYVALVTRTRANVAHRVFRLNDEQRAAYATPATTANHLADFEPLRGVLPVRAESPFLVYARIREMFIEPRLRETGEASFSMLLYGPPGTGKSTVAEELAKALGWEMLTLTPSDFISGGGERAEARAKALFQMLEEQPRTVVLLDEIDRMILDRDAKAYAEQEDIFQFMTPSMLVKLKDLRERGRCIFIVATNYAERIDPAAKRLGRIDVKLLVNPPDRTQRESIIKRETARAIVKGTERASVRAQTEAVEALMDQIRDENKSEFESVDRRTVLMAYTEIARVAKDISKEFRTRKKGLVGSADKATLLAAFKSKTERLEPAAIRLQSYDGRFRQAAKGADPPPPSDAGFPTAQEPFAEFLLLVHLKAEVDEIADQEVPLIRRVLRRLYDPAKVDMMGEGADPDSAREIAKWLGDDFGDPPLWAALTEKLKGRWKKP